MIQVLFFLIVFPSNARTGSVIEVGKFSGVKELDGIPQGWEPLTFRKIKNHNRYPLVVDEGIRVVKAVSNSSSSGLIRKISIDPTEPSTISGVAIMTDTDNTLESAVTFYGDIIFKKQ